MQDLEYHLEAVFDRLCTIAICTIWTLHILAELHPISRVDACVEGVGCLCKKLGCTLRYSLCAIRFRLHSNIESVQYMYSFG